jgi:hypothetical protein
MLKTCLGTAKRVAEGGSSPRDGLVEPTNRKFTARLSESVRSGKKLRPADNWVTARIGWIDKLLDCAQL